MFQGIIGFIIKIEYFGMQPSTPISAYKHIDQNQSPTIPSVLRSRHKGRFPENDPLKRVRQLITHPTEIVIDAHRYNQQNGSVVPRKQEGIRGEIDACLTAVEKVYEQEARKKGSRAGVVQVIAGEPVLSTNSIHRVDSNLIMKYIGTVRQEYGLTDRFSARRNIVDPRSPRTIQVARNPEQRYTSVGKRNNSRRSFINLTLSTNHQKRQPSATKPTTGIANRGKSPSTIHSPGIHQHPASPKKIEKYHIPQEFRYCICCEKSILSSNIAYHEEHECLELQKIYKMSFIQLKKLIAYKISAFRRTIHEKLMAFSQSRENEQKGQPTEKVVSSIQKYLDELQGDDETRELSFLQVRDNYLKFKQTLQGDFFDCIALTHKLDYFIRVYVQLTRTGNAQNLLQHAPQPITSQDQGTVPVSHFQPEH